MSESTGRVLVSELLRYVDVHVPKAPRALTLQCVQDVIYEFMKETQVYTCLLCPENIRKDIDLYEFERPNRMVRVDLFHKVWFDGSEISPGTFISNASPHQNNSQLFPTRGYARTGELEIKLLFIPSLDILGGLEAEAILVPARSVEPEKLTIPCGIFEDNYIGMANGVIAKMKAMRGKAWSDRAGAARYDFLYNKGKQEARVDQNRFSTNVRVVARAPRAFAGGGRRIGKRR